MIKRPLFLFICFFILGICAVIFSVNIFAATVMLIIALMPFLLWKRIRLITAVVILLFFVSGIVRMNAAQKSTAELCVAYDSQKKNTNVLITDFSDGKNAVGEFSDKGKTVKIYLTLKKEQKLYPGDIISGEFSLRTPFASKITKSDFSSYLRSRGIYLHAYADEVLVADCYTKGLRGTVFTLRRYIDSLGVRNFEGNGQALFNAMILGDKSKMSDSLADKLQGAGLNHIAVVSGMHLSIMIAVQMFIINRIFGKRRMGTLLAMLGAIFITLFTGCGVSVVRACVMCIIYQAAGMFYRERDSLTSLAIAGGIMCLYNPYILFNAGFVLSVLSVLGIILYSQKINGFLLYILPEKISNAAALCISAQLTVTPAAMFYFNIFTPYALLSNVLIFAFVSVYVIFGLAFCVFAYVPILGAAVKYIAELSCSVIEYICTLVSGLWNAVVDTARPDGTFVFLWVFMLIIIHLYPKKKNMLLPFSLIFTVFTIAVNAAYKTDDSIRFLSVAYGEKSTTAALLPEDELLLIDCADKWDIPEIASHFGKESFDYAVVTTDDETQITDMIESGYVKNLLLPAEQYSSEERAQIFENSRECNMRTTFLKNGEYIFSRGAFIEYIPIEQISNEQRGVKIEYKGKSFVSLQGLKSRQIQKLCDGNIKIDCDCLQLPFTILNEKTSVNTLTDGKIVQREKEFILNK